MQKQGVFWSWAWVWAQYILSAHTTKLNTFGGNGP